MSENTNAPEGANAGGAEVISVNISHGGIQIPVNVPSGTDLGHVRSLNAELQRLGAPSNFKLGVNGVGREDDYILSHNDVVSFRPVAGEKG